MIKFNELKQGDYVMAEYNGQQREGEVIQLNGDEKQVCIQSGDQDFWFETDHLYPIVLDESQLFRLGFQKHVNDNGSLKYMKGAFRVLLHQPNNFSEYEIWYREDRRHICKAIYVHEFQNHYLEMTKVHLTVE
jgi:hypothetical protein